MTPQDALCELLARLGASKGAAVLVSEEELSHWPEAAVKAMKSHKLLAKANPANSAVCPGCEEACAMPVHMLTDGPHGAAAFIVCDKRDDINRVTVAAGQLRQWQFDTDAVRGFVAQNLGLRRSDRPTTNAELWEIGMVTGNKRSQMLCLRADGEMDLVAGDNILHLADLVRFRDGAYSVDSNLVRQLVDSATTADNRYTPSNARREARKLDTQAIYAKWQREYQALKKRRPDMSDVWYSQQIATIQGHNAETIRKHMKK